MDIQIITGIEDASLRERWSEFVRSSYAVSGSHKIVGTVFESLSEALDHASTTTESGGIIVVSDQHDEFLIEMKDKLCDIAPSILATVALVTDMPADRRLTDIDGVLASSAKPEAWATTLDRVVAKLAYMRRPTKVAAANDIASVESRELQTIDEFRDGLRLRHDVYSIMGYLEYGYLATGSRLEANWCDTRAKHYGLFVTTTEGDTELAATARVILTNNWPTHSQEWVEQIVRPRRALAAHIQTQQGVLARWILPAFESMHFPDLMIVAFAEQQWGELSRVIVSQKWRGYGMSKELVRFVLRDMDASGVDGLVLECLPIHTRLYQALGFEEVGQTGVTDGIATTMTGMKSEPPFGEKANVASRSGAMTSNE